MLFTAMRAGSGIRSKARRLQTHKGFGQGIRPGKYRERDLSGSISLKMDPKHAEHIRSQLSRIPSGVWERQTILQPWCPAVQRRRRVCLYQVLPSAGGET